MLYIKLQLQKGCPIRKHARFMTIRSLGSINFSYNRLVTFYMSHLMTDSPNKVKVKFTDMFYDHNSFFYRITRYFYVQLLYCTRLCGTIYFNNEMQFVVYSDRLILYL